MTDHEQENESQPSFTTLGIDAAYIESMLEKDIVEPAVIQRAAIPPISEGRDVIVHSGTGTGKTLAYVLPLLGKIDFVSKEMQWLVVVPTQELAMQIVREIEALIGTGKVAPLIGGASLQRQIDRLKTHPPIAVGTPGRLIELMKMRKIKLHHIRHVVIDEVDQVYSLGAAGEVDMVLASVPGNRQLVFVTATVTEAIERTAMKRMKDPIFVRGQSQAEATASVEHQYIVCERREKIDLVRRLIRTVNPATALIFVKETEIIGELEAKLKFAGLQVESLYGDAGKQERATVMKRFASGKLRLLIASDVASRGIDVTRISHVINFEPPIDPQQYIHRSGRTGRMGRSGTVVTLATVGERAQLTKLAARLGITLQEKILTRGEWKNTLEKHNPLNEKPAAGQAKEAAVKVKPVMKPVEAKPIIHAKTVEKDRTRERERVRDRKNKGAPRWLKNKSKDDTK